MKWLKELICGIGFHDLDIMYEDKFISIFKCRNCKVEVEKLK